MKTLIRTALAALLWVSMLPFANACDICGCSISNNNPFLFPSTSRHFIGLSWYHHSYRLQGEDGSLSHMPSTNISVNAQYAIGSRIRLQAVLPYMMNHYSSNTGKETKSGIGDISLLANYILFSHANGALKQMVTLTGGIKLATASATPSANPPSEMADLQTGSGSTDFIAAATYRLTYTSWIALLQAGYRYNNQDSQSGLRFGDVSSASLNLYHKIPFSYFTLTPYATGTIESKMDDARNHILLKGSGGTVLLLGAGVDINTRKIAIGINCLSPVAQSLSNGAIHESLRLNTHVFFTL